MDTRKVLGIIFSILFVGAFTFVLCWGIINFNKVKEGMSGTGVYTQEDVNNAYQDGYDTALEDKAEYDELINSYRDTITTQTDQISQLSSQVTNLTNNNKDYANQITNLESQKSNLESQVDNLTTIKVENEITIAELNIQVDDLKNELTEMQNSFSSSETELERKNAQILNLQNTVTQLQKTNDLNVQTINSLNNQITSLNSQISETTIQIQNNSTNVSSLNNKIAELEKSVAYYEQYIASLESGEQVVATFEFNGSVYNIQIVNPNSTLSVTTPTSTNFVIFNYWTVDGVQIDLATYKITQNTKIVADVTYRYETEFIVNDEVYNYQIVTENNYATLPENPSMEGYVFDGWTLNAVDVINPETTPITANTKFIARFTKLHTVTFMYESEILSTQLVRNGNCATAVNVVDTTYKIFNGWTYNGASINLETYKISGAITFIADITYKYDVKYIVDETEYRNQIVIDNGYATVPTSPTKIGYDFDGWTLDGENIVNPSTIVINQDTNFIAKFTKLHTVTFVYEDSEYSTQTIRNNECPESVVVDSTNYQVFNGWKLNDVIVDITTQKIVSDTIFVADITYKYDVVFMVDNVIYNSQIVAYNNCATLPQEPSKDSHKFLGWSLNGTDLVENIGSIKVTQNTTYIALFKGSLDTLTVIEWNGLSKFTGAYNWYDGDNIYTDINSKTYILNKETRTWTEISFNGLANPGGVWSDGVNLYSSVGTTHYVYDRSSSTWVKKTWSGLTNFSPGKMWRDGDKIYYSSMGYHYLLDVSTSTWSQVTWNGYGYVNGNYVWTDGENIYSSSGTGHYVLNRETNTWEDKIWKGLSSFDGNYIWSDGEYIYYSKGTEQYVLDIESSKWIPKTWNNYNDFNGNCVWTDGEYWYYSYTTTHYIFSCGELE